MTLVIIRRLICAQTVSSPANQSCEAEMISWKSYEWHDECRARQVQQMRPLTAS